MPAPPAISDFADLLPETTQWPGRPTAADLSALPNPGAVFLLADEGGRPIQALSALQLRRAVTIRLTTPTERGKRADLGEIVRQVRWRTIHSRFEARWVYLRVAQRLDPRGYRELLGFGPAWFLHLDRSRLLPEIRVSERVFAVPGDFVGPWRTQRAAQSALELLWDLFDLCRHPEQLRRTPGGKRCAYFDMGRCDGPCDGTAPPDPYAERTRQAWEFAAGAQQPWIAAAETRMRAAAAEQRFELAGQLKKQLEAARRVAAAWGRTVRRAEDWHELIVVPAPRRRAWKPFEFRAGALRDGPLLKAKEVVAGTRAWLTAETSAAPGPTEAPLRMEQSWLVAQLHERLDREPAFVLRLNAATAAGEVEEFVRASIAGPQGPPAGDELEPEREPDSDAGAGSDAESDARRGG